MKTQSVQISIDSTVVELPSDAFLSLRWSNFIRVVWIITSLSTLGLIALSVPAYISQLGIITPIEVKAGALAGLSYDVPPGFEYAVDFAYMVVALAASLLCLLLAAVIFQRRADR